MPPVFGKLLATSARASAPHIARTPPTTHTSSIGPGPGSRPAIPAGDRKIPDPIVMPTTIITALRSPRRRGSPSFAVGVADMRLWYCGTQPRASELATIGVRLQQKHFIAPWGQTPTEAFGCSLVSESRWEAERCLVRSFDSVGV